MTDRSKPSPLQLLTDGHELLSSRAAVPDGDGDEYNDDEVCDWLRKVLPGGNPFDSHRAARSLFDRIAAQALREAAEWLERRLDGEPGFTSTKLTDSQYADLLRNRADRLDGGTPDD